MVQVTFIEHMVHETYAAHCILTSLGIEPDEIYVGVQPVANAPQPGPCSLITVRRGDAQFVMTLQSVTEEQAKRYLEAWRQFAYDKPFMARDALDRIVYGSTIYTHRVALITALVAKGFELRPGEMLN